MIAVVKNSRNLKNHKLKMKKLELMRRVVRRKVMILMKTTQIKMTPIMIVLAVLALICPIITPKKKQKRC